MANEKIAKQAEIELILQRLAQYKKVWGETIVGTQTAATGTWTGVSKLATASDMISGYRFTYWLPYAGSGSATLRLTFQDGTTKDIVPYIYNNTRLTTHIGAGNSIDFVYLENANVNGTRYTGAWVCKNHEVDTYDRVWSNYERRFIYSTATPLYRYKICGYNGGKLVPLTITDQTTGTIVQKTPVTVGIDPAMGLTWYYSTTNFTAVSSAVTALYDEIPGTAPQYTFNDTVPAYTDVYLKGTIKEDGLFYLDTTDLKSWYVFAPNRASDGAYNSVFEEGCHYMFVGPASSANNIQFKLKNPVFLFANGVLRNVNGTLPPVDVDDEFLYRDTPSVGDMMSVSVAKGRTLVWNQGTDFIHCAEVYGDRVDGHIERTVPVGSTYASLTTINYTWNPTAPGHKILVSLFAKADVARNVTLIQFFNDGSPERYIQNTISLSTSWQRFTQIYTVPNYDNAVVIKSTQLRHNGAATTEANKLYMKGTMTFDLTLMFGAGNEPTVEEFEKMFPLPYYDYNAGTLISNNAEAVETKGKNLFDGEKELGDYSIAGVKIANSTKVRNANKIPVTPGSTIYYKSPVHCNWYLYGEDGETIVGLWRGTTGDFDIDNPSAQITWVRNTARVIPSNCYYLSFSTYGASYTSTDMLSDFCVNVSDPSFNGQYEPYKRSELSVGLDSFDVEDSQGNVTTITGGLKSAGSVYDEIVGDKYIKRVGSVDLGTLNWSKATTQGTHWRFGVAFSDIPKGDNNKVANLICSKYDSVTPNNTYTGIKGISNNGTSQHIFVCDESYSDTAAFKTAMSGVMLYYELATPEEYTLVKPFPTGYTEIPQGGQQKVLPENTSSSVTTAPLRATFTYTTAAPVSKSAIKLQDSHDIWGQPFDGTKDVTGAMTGVTSIKNSTTPSLIEWDNDKGAWHFKGSLYADGWISALGVGSDSSSTTDLPAVWASLSGHTDSFKDTPIDWAHIVVNRSVTGTGNVVSDVTLTPAADGKSATLSVTKTQVSTALADLTGADDLRAIEALTGTGLLKRTGNNQWALDTTAYLSPANAYIVGNTIHLGQYSELTVLTEHQPIFSLTVNNAAGNAITTYNPASDAATLNLTAAAVGLGNVQNIDLTSWATITGNTDKTITLGSSSVTIPAWAMSLNTLQGSLDQVYHKKFGDGNTAFTASTLTVAQTATISGAAIVGNNNLTNAKIYFGSTGSYLELKNIAASGQTPVYALHSNLPFYSDSWISALGEGEGGSSGGGGGVDNHVLISEEEFENMTTFDDGKIYLVYEDEEA